MARTDNNTNLLTATTAVNKKRITFAPEHPGTGKLAVVLRITNTAAKITNLACNQVDFYNNFQPADYFHTLSTCKQTA